MIVCRFEQDGTGQENMTRDLALLNEFEANGGHSIIRLYTWKPWAVSLGKHQSMDAIDLDIATSLGIDVVHRPTGGRAVLHADELTYCVVSHGLPAEVYAATHQMLHAALQTILGEHSGLLEFDTVGTDLRSHYASGSDLGKACFASSARSEIMVGGRKVVGSAQRVIGNLVLQHGSILCGPSHLQLADLVSIDPARRPAFREALASASVSLSEVAQHVITPMEVALAIQRYVSTSLA